MKIESLTTGPSLGHLDGIELRRGFALPELTADLKLRRLADLTRRDRRRLFWLGLASADVLGLAAAFTLAFAIRFFTALPVFASDSGLPGQITFYAGLVAALLPLWLLVFLVVGLYDEQNLLGGTREYALVFNAVSAGMLLVVFASFLNPQFVVARGWLLIAWLLAFLFVAALRFSLRRAVYFMRARGYFLAPALIVGLNEEALALAEQLVGWRTSGLQVLGFVSPEQTLDFGWRVFRSLFVLGGLDDLDQLVERYGVEELVIATSAVDRAQQVDLFRRYANRNGLNLRLSSGLFEIMTTGLQLKELAYVPLINIHPARLRGMEVVLKTALDFTIACAAVVLGAPLFMALALAIRLDSPGPLLHRRKVLGMGGREFYALKFRTMYANGHEILAGHPELQANLNRYYKLKSDPRVTRIGRVLRKLSLDELPQVFNVLAGQMSVVGPRMISPEEHAEYGQWDLNLLTVKPGITGLWQVSGRSDITYAERVRLDMQYIRNWNIWLDLQILLQTIPAVLMGRGAY